MIPDGMFAAAWLAWMSDTQASSCDDRITDAKVLIGFKNRDDCCPWMLEIAREQ